MLIGHKSSFAIEYSLDRDCGGVWMFGKMCYWIHDEQVGNYDVGTSLRDIFLQFRSIIMDCGNRSEPFLCNDNNDPYSLLDKILYSDDQPGNLLDTPSRFDIRPPVDIFDDWKIYLIDCESYSVIYYKKVTRKMLLSYKIERNEFDNIARKFYEEIEDYYDRLT